MLAFFIKRVFHAAIVMFIISLVAFSIQDSLGDPTRELAALSMSAQEREALREELGLNDPFLTQYGRFLTNALQGDLGNSYFHKKPALDVILDKLPATLELVFGATLIIVLLSVPLGVFSAIKPQHWLSKAIMSLSTLGISVPVFLTAILLIQLFAIGVQVTWFSGSLSFLNDWLSTEGGLPSFGRGEGLVAVTAGWETGFLTLDGLSNLLLPCVALSSIMLPLFIRLIRSEMMEVLQSEYVKYAWAKGIHPWRIYFVHALKNTMLPVITVGGVQIGTMVAYTILTESVFQWPGMGFMFLEAVNRSDIPLIVAYLMVVGLIFVITNTVVDLIYGLVNPQVKLTGK